jgi:hypothetical protein
LFGIISSLKSRFIFTETSILLFLSEIPIYPF